MAAQQTTKPAAKKTVPNANGRAGGSRGTRRHPAHGGSGNKISDVFGWEKKLEDDSKAGSSIVYEEAQAVYRGIRNSSKVPGGLDKLGAARRQRRLLNRAAAALEEAGKNFRAARVAGTKDLGSAQERKGNKGIDMTS